MIARNFLDHKDASKGSFELLFDSFMEQVRKRIFLPDCSQAASTLVVERPCEPVARSEAPSAAGEVSHLQQCLDPRQLLRLDDLLETSHFSDCDDAVACQSTEGIAPQLRSMSPASSAFATTPCTKNHEDGLLRSIGLTNGIPKKRLYQCSTTSLFLAGNPAFVWVLINETVLGWTGIGASSFESTDFSSHESSLGRICNHTN